MRSLDYALAAARNLSGAALQDGRYERLAAAFRERMPAALLAAYRQSLAAAGRDEAAQSADERLLALFMIEKAAYEVTYEVGNRPDWLSVPLRGLAELAARLLDEDDR